MSYNTQSKYLAVSEFNVAEYMIQLKKNLTLPWGSVGSLYALNQNYEISSLISPENLPLIHIFPIPI